jgi:hypothetical protein
MSSTPPQDIATALVAEATESGRIERERQIAERYARLEKTPIPRRALLVAVSGRVEATEAIKIASDWAGRRYAGIVAYSGPVGTGKTVAAAWYACRSGAEWASAPLLGLASHAKAHAEVERLAAAPALVLDEVGGQGTTSPHAVDRISALLSLRHASMRPTVLTTNLDRPDFSRLYDGVDDPDRSRLLDRIREDGRWFTVAGETRRAAPVELLNGRIDQARLFVGLYEAADVLARGDDPRGQGPSQIRAGLQQLQDALALSNEQVAHRIVAIVEARQRMEALNSEQLEQWRANSLDAVERRRGS